jgi:hypothetical protein
MVRMGATVGGGGQRQCIQVETGAGRVKSSHQVRSAQVDAVTAAGHRLFWAVAFLDGLSLCLGETLVELSDMLGIRDHLLHDDVDGPK